MRSAEPRRSTTLAQHLAWTLVIVSVLAASLATAAALLLADTLIRAQFEGSVQAAANVLAVEIDEKPGYIDEGLDIEARELGIDDRVAVIHPRRGVIAGDPSLIVPGERCGMISLGPGHEEFACQAALELDPELRVVVAIPATRIEDHRAPLLRAGFGVIVVVVFGATLVGLALARRMLRPLERLRPEDAARLTIVTGDNDGLVRGDELLLAAMLDNVVDNALKFSTGPVRVAVDERADDVVLRVDDEGPGVSDELAAELFDPFRRTTAARAQPGHGLGLALVAHIAAAYGGSVEFVRGRERGARIEITVPLAR